MAINNTTKDMLSMLPSWMEMRNETSVGAKFLNVPGAKLEELETYVRHEIENTHIGTADIFDIDIIYKTPIMPEVLDLANLVIIGHVNVDGKYESHFIKECSTVYDFYSDEDGVEHKAIIDTGKRACYFRQKYDFVTINGAELYEIILHHVWNCFDEFGLLVGCPRIYGENNVSYKQRILDVFKNPGSADAQGLKNILARELQIPSTDVQVDSLSDPAFQGTLLNIDGSPTDALIGYAKKINEAMSLTWGEASWDKGYWSSVDQDNIGLDYLPHIWDASTDGWLSSDFQSGIGTRDDLYIEAPVRTDDTQEFDYHVGLAGVKYEQTKVYPPHTFGFKVTGKGTVTSDIIIPDEYYYTIVAAPRIPLIFRVKAEKEYEQNPKVDFAEPIYVYNKSSYDSLTPIQKAVGYFVSDLTKIEIVNGTSVPNPPQQFIEIKVDMESNADKTESPTLNDITLSWTTLTNVVKSVKIDTQTGESQDGNNYTVGFTSNTWSTPAAIIRVENDDVNASFPVDGSMTLGYGEYYKMIDTEGDWNRSDMLTNVVVTSDGDLKLSI